MSNKDFEKQPVTQEHWNNIDNVLIKKGMTEFQRKIWLSSRFKVVSEKICCKQTFLNSSDKLNIGHKFNNFIDNKNRKMKKCVNCGLIVYRT